MGCDAAAVVDAIKAAASAVDAEHASLTALDRAIGDGDHGENLRRGFAAATAALDASPPSTPADALKTTAMTLLSTVGGAAGPLYGTAFLRAATALGDSADVDQAGFVAALTAARDGVVARGHADPGDKTMVDALGAAVDAAAAASSLSAARTAAADAAEAAAQATVPMVARKGRASYLGERSAGTADPGATSTALILRAFATSR